MQHASVQHIIDLFEKHKNHENAGPMKSYMKNHFNFLGIKSPLRTQLSRSFLNKSMSPDYLNLENVIKQLWRLPYREYQYVAMELTEKYIKKSDEKIVILLEYMLTTKSWWDTVDFIAARLVGPLFYRFPRLRDSMNKQWIDSGNMWLQRAAILFQLKYKQYTDFFLLKENIIKCSDSRDFFIQKAIGWSLREYSKTNPSEVMEFVASHTLKPLSVKEALRLIKKGK